MQNYQIPHVKSLSIHFKVKIISNKILKEKNHFRVFKTKIIHRKYHPMRLFKVESFLYFYDKTISRKFL